MKYWAFISYTNADEGPARALHQFLERYSLPAQLAGQRGKFGEPVPRRLYPVFLDRDELGSGASLPEELKRRLDEARWLVVICTRNTPKSRWVREEVEYFARTRDRRRIICVFPDGIEDASMAAQLPAPLAGAADVPLGVDLSGKEPVAVARLRLVASLAGVEFSALRDREGTRKRRRQALAAGLFILGGAALFAMFRYQQQARDDAIYSSALSNAGLPASVEDAQSLKSNVSATLSPIVTWRGRRFVVADGLVKHAPPLDDAEYVFDPGSNLLVVLNKEGEDSVSLLGFPSLDTVIGQADPTDDYGLDYKDPAIKLKPGSYILYARTQSSSAGGTIPVLVLVEGEARKVAVFGLDGRESDMLVSADCTSFAMRAGDTLRLLSIGRTGVSIAADDWRMWEELGDPKRHACTNLLPLVRRDQ